MPTQTPQQAANALNPTPVNYTVPTTGLWRGVGDSQGDAIFKTNPDGSITQYQVGGPSGVASIKSQYGLDFWSLPSYNQGDVFQAAAKSGAIRPNSAGTGYDKGFNIGNLTDLAQPNTPAGSTTAAMNTTPNQLGDIAGATAAQTQQLAGDQGMNVTQTTTPEGVAAVTKTPLAQPANGGLLNPTPSGATPAQTTTPTQSAGAGGSPPIDYTKHPNETIDQYNSRIAMSGGPVAPTGTSTGAAGTIDTNYQMKPGETIDSYNARIAAYNASKPTTQVSGQVGASGTMAETATATGTDKYAGLDPVAKQVAMYTDAYKALGLNTIKDQFDQYTKQQADLTDEMNQKIQDTQNNPWLSQGVVDKTVQRIKDSYATKLDTLTHLLTLTDSLYKQGQAQVDTMVSAANADIKATNDLAQKQIDAANAIAKDNEVVSTGGRELLINKDTGKTVADLGPTTPSSTANSGFSLSAGQTRFDAQGNPIASVAPKTPTPKTSTSTAKGTQTSQAFVESTLDNQGLDYNTVISSIPSGRMGVIDNKTGTVGTILPTEFDASKYTQL